MKSFLGAAIATILLTGAPAGGQTPMSSTIHVQAKQILNRVSPLLTGACIEDVNHEIYGGLYSQMIFGEWFQEPPLAAPPDRFQVLGGRWEPRQGVLHAAAGEGPKLLWEGSPMADGTAGIEVYFPDNASGNAGLILNVTDPSIGADAWTGYEISLEPARNVLVLGRHRRNWEPLKEVSCPVPVGRWIPLVVRRSGNTLSISVNGQEVLMFDDTEHPLPSGQVGLRTWQRSARFRDMFVELDGVRYTIPFRLEPGDYPAVSGMWRPISTGTAQGSWEIAPRGYHPDQQGQRLTFTSGKGAIGVENAGLNRWGMHFAKDRPYEGILWVRSDHPVSYRVALQSRDGGRIYAAKERRTKSNGWEMASFTLTPDADDVDGRFAIELTKPGAMVLGYAFLQKGAWGRYKHLPVRKDVVEGLKQAGITVLRYGGLMANAPDYRWKNMVGSRHSRRPYKGYWYPYASNGFGILDFMAMCRAMRIIGIPDFSMDETPQDMADFVTYMTAPLDSPIGRKRLAEGFDEAFDLPFIQLGNEEAVDEDYWRKFRPLAEAIWKVDSKVILIVGDFSYGELISDPYNIQGAPRISSLAAHKKILDLAKENNREVWFDIHIWNDSPQDPDKQLLALRDFIQALERISPGAPFKVCVLEENANNHTMRRALAHAKVINDLQRIGDRVQVLCAANGLQPNGQNDNGWDQGLLFLSPSKVWAQPSYYVTQMFSRPEFTKRVGAVVTGDHGALDVTARLSEDEWRLLVQVVNRAAQTVTSTVTLDGFEEANVRSVVTLAAPLDAVNTEIDPECVRPRSAPDIRTMDGAGFSFPAGSVTTLEFWRQRGRR